MPPWGPGVTGALSRVRQRGGRPPGAPGRCSLAASAALVHELEPGLSLSALGSCPDALPRGLGRSVPMPPAAGSPGSRGSTRSGRQTTGPGGGARPGPLHPRIWALGGPEAATPLWTLWFGGLASLSPVGPARHAASPSLPCWPHWGPQRPPGPRCPGETASHGDGHHVHCGQVPRVVTEEPPQGSHSLRASLGDAARMLSGCQ